MSTVNLNRPAIRPGRLHAADFVDTMPTQPAEAVTHLCHQADAEPDTTGDGVMLGRAIVMCGVIAAMGGFAWRVLA